MRYAEIDICRGIAVLMMIIFHFLFDFSFFSLYPVNVSTGFWRYFGYATAISFVLLAGISVTLKASKYKSDLVCIIALIKRGVSLLLIGMLISLGTWIYLGEGFILFGILHLIGISIILSPLILKIQKIRFLNWILGVGIIAVSPVITSISGPIWLVWLGVHPDTFFSVDYTPLFPWFGIFIIGIAVGEYLYPQGKRAFHIQEGKISGWSLLIRVGQHSLILYLIHQPVLIGLFSIGRYLNLF